MIVELLVQNQMFILPTNNIKLAYVYFCRSLTAAKKEVCSYFLAHVTMR